MSAPSLTNAPKPDSVVPYTNYRVALATATLGSLGATTAWIALLAFETGDSHLFITIVVGALVGLAAHWIQHYIRVAIRERSGESGGHDRHPLAAVLWATSFAFLSLATEHSRRAHGVRVSSTVSRLIRVAASGRRDHRLDDEPRSTEG